MPPMGTMSFTGRLQTFFNSAGETHERRLAFRVLDHTATEDRVGNRRAGKECTHAGSLLKSGGAASNSGLSMASASNSRSSTPVRRSLFSASIWKGKSKE